MSESQKSRVVSGLTKGMPFDLPPTPLEEVGEQGWNLLRGDVPLPCAVLLHSALKHNSNWMRKFVEQSGVLLAPHGKTTMCPEVFELQLDDGAWGMTAATTHQVRVYRQYGIQHIFLANQLLLPLDVRYVANEMNNDPDFDFICLVDSVDGCELLAGNLREAGIRRPLQVMVELGLEGRRTGARGVAAATRVAEAAHQHEDVMTLIGVEGFEGMVYRPTANVEEMERWMIEFLDSMASLASDLARRGLIQRRPVLLSAGGSTHYDVVVDRLAPDRVGVPTQLILRSGCYIAHDHKMYRDLHNMVQARRPDLRDFGDGLKPALEVWAAVQSRPDPDRVICTLGRRDVGTDTHLPMLHRWWRPGVHTAPLNEDLDATVVEVNDQHCHMTVPTDSPLAVGDFVCFGISHPCTTFDKWRALMVVDDEYNVISAYGTYF